MVDRDDGEWASDDETCAIDFAAVDMAKGEDTAYLIILSGSRVGEMVRVKSRVTIGRGETADLRVRDEGVSRLHARVEQQEDGSARVVDLGSRNGTFVNGERIEDAALKDGDKILIGQITILKFSYADQAEEAFQRQMYDSALRDPLTGLYNRRFLTSQLESEFSYSVRHQTSLSLVMIDIDHFKSVNDTYGHPVGDHVLVGLSNLLTGAIRTEDLAARYGGEEFVLVCRGISAPVAQTVVNRIRRMIEKTSLVTDHPERSVTISAGVASVPHPRIGDAQALVDASDKALYEAKNGGRNRVEIF